MELLNFKKELKSLQSQTKIQSYYALENEVILCNHCQRTATNGIRCLGMCVADNDY